MKTDFQRLRQRLNESMTSLDRQGDDQAVENALRKRSRELAKRGLEDSSQSVFGEVVVVRRAGVSMATPIAATHEVREVEVTGFPGSGDIINGVFQIRGNTHCLVDLAPFFGPIDPIENGQSALIVLVSGAPGDLGLRVDEILGQRTLLTSEVTDGLEGDALDFVSHVTTDYVHVIDVEALMASQAVRLRR